MYLVLCCFILFVLVFFLVSVFHSFLWDSSWFGLLGLRSWVGSFECGFVSQQGIENYFSYSYFVMLVFFVVFDLEISLLLNLPLQGVLFKNLSYYFFFLLLIGVGFGFEVNKGYVSWSV